MLIIYLAAAAPFGVAAYLREPPDAEFPRALLRASGVALVWPLTLLRRLRFQRTHRVGQPSLAPPPRTLAPLAVRRVEARRVLLSALYQTEDCAQQAFGRHAGIAVRAVRECVAGVEGYAELTRAVAELSDETETAETFDDQASFPRTLELCRLAGREGDDLLIAARCLQRRHVARLRTHQADARLQLLKVLAALREVLTGEPTRHLAPTSARRILHHALLETYTRALDLFAQLGDEPAVSRVALLFDTTHASLPRHEPPFAFDAPETLAAAPIAAHSNDTGDEPCLTSNPIPDTKRRLISMPTIKAHG